MVSKKRDRVPLFLRDRSRCPSDKSQFSVPDSRSTCYSFFVDKTARQNDEGRWNLLYKKAQEARAVEAFGLFREYGIEPVLIKGLAAARFYPDDKTRLSVDMDIAVAAEVFETANAIAAAAAPKGLAIDLHRELRHLDTVPWDDLFANSQLLDVDGGAIRVLRPEDHLRVLIVHWLTDGGADRDRLWDIYYGIANRPDDFAWERFLDVVGPNRRRWLVCAAGLAHHFLELDLDDTPIKDEALKLPPWLLQAVEHEWASGTKLLPLHLVLGDRKSLFAQIRKRLRPNPIFATVELDGSFDAPTRVLYQIRHVFKRMLPSYNRVSQTITSRKEI